VDKSVFEKKHKNSVIQKQEQGIKNSPLSVLKK